MPTPARRIVPRLVTALAAALAAPALAAPAARAQQPNASYADAFEVPRRRTDPAAVYTVRVDTTDLTGYAVALELRVPPDARSAADPWGGPLTVAFPRWAPGAYRLAEFGRYARDLTATADGRPVPVTALADGRWRLAPPARSTDGRPGWRTLRVAYRVRFPTPAAAAAPNNRNFLTARGGLFDGPLTFAYVEGGERLPAHVRLELPATWRTATGLTPTGDPRTFFARGYDALVDSPVLAGPADALRVWAFAVDGVPHRVAYWAQPGAAAFDTARFVATAERAVGAARAVMGELPYRDYTFLFVDGTGGGLEHLNSTTIGARAASLARDPTAAASVTAHEFWHLWNVKRLRPAELGPFDYQRAVRTPSLWWSEGVTDFFADEILRRAGLRDSAAAVADLADALQSLLGNPASLRVSPERSSHTAWDRPDVNAGYSVSYYLQGKLLGELLELRLRAATGGRRGMDDVMRRLYDRFAGARGFAPGDVEQAVAAVCAAGGAPGDAAACGWVAPLFADHVRAARPADWAGALALAGWRLDTARVAAADSAGRPLPDLRASVVTFAGVGSAGGAAGGRPRLSVTGPHVAAYRAGLRTGDEVVAANGAPVDGPEAWRRATAGLRVGDTLVVDVVRDGRPARVTFVLSGYDTLRVRLTDLPAPTERRRLVRQVWLRGPAAGAG
jgi:predicted metalloprotease with PDZ domain